MKTLTALCYNPETDDLFAAIIQDGKCFCYSHIGQHSSLSESYFKDCYEVEISLEAIALWNEVKGAYNDCKPTLISYSEMSNIIDNEQIKFEL